MLRNLACFALLFFVSESLSAQDTLYKINHDKVIVKVQEVGPEEVKYKRFSDADGPQYIVKQSELFKIVYASGHTDYFNDLNENGDKDKFTPGRRWMVGVNAFDGMWGVVSMSAEYSFPKSGLTIKIPVSFGLNAMVGNKPNGYSDLYYYSKDKLFSSGFQMLLYPGGRKHRASYYIGMAFELGLVNHDNNYYYWDFAPFPTANPQPTWYAATGVTNGVMLKVSDRINVGIDATFGMMVVDERYNDYRPMARLGITMGYRFGKDRSE